MTTPAINTPYSIIGDAYQDAGLIQEGDSPSPEQLAKGMRRLRRLVNVWQLQGLKLWTNVDTAVPLVAGTNTYTFAPSGSVDMVKPLRVLEGYYLYTVTNVRRPLRVMAWRDFLTLGQVGTLTSNRGCITQYLVKKKATELEVVFWLCPDAVEAANGQAHVLLQTQVTNATSIVETMDFPLEWSLGLEWGLADELCTGQPQAIMDRCATRAATYRTVLEDFDVEDAPTNFAPDYQNGYAVGGFV